eukprot:3067128-Rhodomonas_salina.5
MILTWYPGHSRPGPSLSEPEHQPRQRHCHCQPAQHCNRRRPRRASRDTLKDAAGSRCQWKSLVRPAPSKLEISTFTVSEGRGLRLASLTQGSECHW